MRSSYFRIHDLFYDFVYQEGSYPNVRILEIGERQHCKNQLPGHVSVSRVRVTKFLRNSHCLVF